MDRAEAIKYIDSILPYAKPGKEYESLHTALAALREQDVADTNVGHKNEWISVKERLPEHGKRVLATDGTFVGEAYLSDSNSWYRGLGFRWINLFDREVTHWMPLPEPPEGGAEG